MKKFKKLIAGLSAAAMALTVGVSALAEETTTEGTTTEETTVTASYADGYVRLSDNYIDANQQWTVIIISKDKQNATLADTDLLYINQGTSVDEFWTGTTTTNEDSTTTVSGGMGVKDGSLDPGDYIVRIGNEAGVIKEVALNVPKNTTTKTYTYGDVNNSGRVDSEDAMEILYKYSRMKSVFDDKAGWRVTAGDVNKSGKVDSEDAMEIMYKYSRMKSVFDTMNPKTFDVEE